MYVRQAIELRVLLLLLLLTKQKSLGGWYHNKIVLVYLNAHIGNFGSTVHLFKRLQYAAHFVN